MARLRLCLLGPFQSFLDEEAITGFDSNKVRAMLAYLAAESRRPQKRATLADLLWPNWPEKSAMRNLTFALANLRKNIADHQAQPPFLLINRDGLQLNPKSDIQVDLWEFDRFIGNHQSEIKNLKSAIALYRGVFLEGFSLADSAPFEEWLASTRQVVNQQMVQTLGELGDAYLEQGDYAQGLPYARRRVELEPWLEEGHQQLMRLLALSGQRSQALAQYETCRKVLKDEFGVEPGKETEVLVEQIRVGTLSRPVSTPEPPMASISLIRPKHNLPLELTRFFGRETEIHQIKQRLAAGRLVTLTGAGGVGKTRLAQRVAAEVLEDYREGVWFIELASTSDQALVAQQVATSLGLLEETEQLDRYVHTEIRQAPLEVLKGYLSRRTTLIILDNCEHLLDACAGLADSLLHTCPYLKILATTREPLGVAGEAIYRVPSLPFPEHGQGITPERIDAFAAIRLFTDRAGQILPGYQVTTENAGAVASVCQRLDGIPLAIELAAARLSVLTAEELATHLGDAFHLLTGGSRASLPRQQTLRATIDWSYRLLNEQESRLFRRLAVFAGGWDLAGAEGVCAGDELTRVGEPTPPRGAPKACGRLPTGAGLEVSDILELLANLVNKSLVIVSPSRSRGTCFRMLETIRQYAQEKLSDGCEMTAFQQRHLNYYVGLAETLEPQERGPGRVEWRHRLEDELENLRQALETGMKADPSAGMRLASALWNFLGEEGVRWLSTYLDHPANAARSAQRGHALWRLSYQTMGIPESEVGAKESLDIFRELNDRAGQGLAHLAWGWCAVMHEDVSTARLHSQAAQEILEEVGDRWGLANSLNLFARAVLFYGGHPNELACLEKELALYQEIGDQDMIADVLSQLGWSSYLFWGDLRKGYALLGEAECIGRQTGYGRDLFRLAEVSCWQGEFARAQKAWEEQLEIARQSDDASSIHVNYLFSGRWICLSGRLETGIVLMEQAVKFFKEYTSPNNVLATQQTFLMELAYAHACLGEVERAESLVAEFWQFFQDASYQPRLMKLLGFLAFQKGEAEPSLEYYRQSLKCAIQIPWPLESMLALEGYAWALSLNAKPVEAARMLGAAAEFRTRIGSPVFPRDRPVYDQVVTTLKESLGEESFAAAWAEGQAQGFDKAIENALKDG